MRDDLTPVTPTTARDSFLRRSAGALVIVAIALLLGRGVTLQAAETAAEEIVLHFPRDRSLGVIRHVSPPFGDMAFQFNQLHATGEVRVPKAARTLLVVNQASCQDLSPLAELAKEGLFHLWFQNASLDEAAMEQIASADGIKSLNFDLCNLTDLGLQRLSKLSSLTGISISDSPITDDGIARLESIRNLEELSLSRTNVTDDVWASIVKFKQLKVLRLNSKLITDLDFADSKDLSNLEVLSFDNVPEVSDAAMEHLAGVSQLKYLHLHRRPSVKISDNAIARLSSLDNLLAIDLHFIAIEDEGMLRLKPMKSLTELGLPTGITDRGLSRIGEFSTLKSVTCQSPLVSDAGIARICALPHIESLNLSGDRITDEGMKHVARLAGLKSLILQNCQMTDAGLAALAALKSLELLMINKTRITDEGLVHLRQFPALRQLSIRDISGSDGGLSRGFQHLGALGQLTHLELGNWSPDSPPLGDADLEHIVGLKKLRSLMLNRFNISDSGVERLVELPALEWLNLDPTASLSDDALGSISRMVELRSLTIGGAFTDRGLGYLAQSPALGELRIFSNSLSDEAVAKLGKVMIVKALPQRAPRAVAPAAPPVPAAGR